MDAALDDIAFLANSENRVAVFELLVEDPRSRDEVRDQIDASRVTVARVFRELDERRWIEQSGRTYEVTPLGEWIYDEFTRLVGAIEAEHRLRDPFQWLPSEVVTFDVQCLRDADIHILDGSDTTAVIRWIVDFHRSGERVRGVTRGVAPMSIENQWELTVHGDTTVELVLTPAALDVIRNHPPTARKICEMLDAENACYSVHEDVPISVGIVDGAVGIILTDEQGVLKGRLLTTDETVHEWAVDLFETCRDDARPVHPDMISV
jgi:predicted transcriptional regulator